MAAVVGLAVLIRAAEDIFYDEVLLGLVFDSPLPLPLAMGDGGWYLDFNTAYTCLIALPIYFSPCRFLLVRSEDWSLRRI